MGLLVGIGMRCLALLALVLALVLSLGSAAEGLQLSESTTAKPLTQLVGREYLTELKPQAKDGQSWAQMSAQLERIEAKLAMLLEAPVGSLAQPTQQLQQVSTSIAEKLRGSLPNEAMQAAIGKPAKLMKPQPSSSNLVAALRAILPNDAIAAYFGDS